MRRATRGALVVLLAGGFAVFGLVPGCGDSGNDEGTAGAGVSGGTGGSGDGSLGSSAGGTSAGGTSTGGTSTGGTSAGGTSAGGTNAGGTSAGGTSAGGTSAGGTAGAGGSGACGNTQCTNCKDDDSDGKIDGADPECTGAADNDESSFATGIPGDNQDPKWQDCFFDGNSGAGDDGCRYHTDCLTGAKPQTDPDCQVSKACLDFCLQFVPNGCDCFGCCAIVLPDGSSKTVKLTPSCTIADINDPTKCTPCTQATICTNDCGRCELCLGKTTLPPDCTPDGGVGTGGSAGTGGTAGSGGSTGGSAGTTGGSGGSGGNCPTPICSGGKQPCGVSCLPPCPTGFFCLTGCCTPPPP